MRLAILFVFPALVFSPAAVIWNVSGATPNYLPPPQSISPVHDVLFLNYIRSFLRCGGTVEKCEPPPHVESIPEPQLHDLMYHPPVTPVFLGWDVQARYKGGNWDEEDEAALDADRALALARSAWDWEERMQIAVAHF